MAKWGTHPGPSNPQRVPHAHALEVVAVLEPPSYLQGIDLHGFCQSCRRGRLGTGQYPSHARFHHVTSITKTILRHAAETCRR
jgi:hypothetical protein